VFEAQDTLPSILLWAGNKKKVIQHNSVAYWADKLIILALRQLFSQHTSQHTSVQQPVVISLLYKFPSVLRAHDGNYSEKYSVMSKQGSS
jgi:hypothetical protein